MDREDDGLWIWRLTRPGATLPECEGYWNTPRVMVLYRPRTTRAKNQQLHRHLGARNLSLLHFSPPISLPVRSCVASPKIASSAKTTIRPDALYSNVCMCRGAKVSDTLTKVRYRPLNFSSEMRKNCSMQAMVFLQMLLEKSYSKRCSANAALHHPWILARSLSTSQNQIRR